MRKVTITLLLICLLFNGKLLGQFTSRTTRLATNLSSANGFDCIRIFDVLSNGTVDTFKQLFILHDRLTGDSVRANMYNRPESLRYFKPTDTVLIVANKKMLRDDSDYYWYRIWKNGQLYRNWNRVGFTVPGQIIGNYYLLFEDHSTNRVQFDIDLYDRSGKQIQSLTLNRSSSLRVWGIYLNKKIKLVREQLASTKQVDYNTIGYFPPSYAQASYPEDYVDTFSNSSGTHFYLPHNFTISTDDSVLFLLGHLSDSSHYLYLPVGSFQHDSNITWIALPKGAHTISLGHLRAGNYELHIRTSDDQNNTLEFRFTVSLPVSWYRTAWFYWLTGAILSALIFALIFALYRRFQGRKMRNREQQLRMKILELRVFRSQLNPHFIFNALNSIQFLVNKNDNEKANIYLSRFSLLLRATLDQATTEYWTLKEELDLLENYISLEKLRFLFEHNLEVNGIDDPENTPFPAMLLQPIVENAIKHGIAKKYADGLLSISIERKEHKIKITITDNGSGFDHNRPPLRSHGISLTVERVNFLNETQNDHKIDFIINSSSAGTTAIFYYIHDEL